MNNIESNDNMNNCTNSAKNEGVQKRKRHVKINKRWTENEKMVLLSILKKHGHSDINKFVEVLPTKNRYHISRYLNRFKRMASAKLKIKHYDTQKNLSNVNQWLPFINVHCNVEATLFRNLSALVLPIFEKYATHPNVNSVGNVDFRKAYRFLFNSLTNKPMEGDINKETLAMLIASFNQLLEEIRTDTSEVSDEFKNSIDRILQMAYSQSKSKKFIVNCEDDVLKMPEVNAFFWNEQEIETLCQKKK